MSFGPKSCEFELHLCHRFNWSVNFFRRTMHSKSQVVNLAEQHETLLVNKWVAICNSELLLIFKKAVPIHLLINHCFISLQFSKYKWFYHFIITQVIFRYFFCVGIGNKLLRVCYNFDYLYRVWNWYYQHFYGVKCSLQLMLSVWPMRKKHIIL